MPDTSSSNYESPAAANAEGDAPPASGAPGPVPMRIEFVSDVACPWCAVGLGALDVALGRLAGAIDASVRFEPFELNPQMGPEGQDLVEHITQKYGSTPEQQRASRAAMHARGAEAGFSFRPEGRGRVWNTFDAHRLLAWAATVSPAAQRSLKQALLKAYHGRAEHMADGNVLARLAGEAGLDEARAAEILGSDAFAGEVREREQYWQQMGISAVPSVIVNGRHLIQGGQPADTFEAALRQIAAAEPHGAHSEVVASD